MLVTLTAATCLSEAAACSEQAAVGSARNAAAGYFAAFERFERWAERSVSSDVRLQGEQALRETVFAPLRRDRDVLWAEVLVDERQVLAYRTPLPDAALKFTPIEAPTLGRVQVALCDACDAKQGECVVIARPATRRFARVRMAFCRSSEQQPVAPPEIAKSTVVKPAAAKPKRTKAIAASSRRSKDAER